MARRVEPSSSVDTVGETSGPLARLRDALRKRLGGRARASWQPSATTLQNWEALRTIPASPLRAVIGVGQSTRQSGITVELLAFEVRGAGAVIHWRARSDRDVILLSAAVLIVDQLGTSYRVIAGGGEGSAEAWQAQTFLLPPPPPGARLSITLESFGPWDERPLLASLPAEVIPGPWSFKVDVPTDDIGEP